MVVFSIITFGLATVREVSRLLSAIKNNKSDASLLGISTCLISMIVAYIWFLNLITK
jgi:hypothetical protein